VRAVAGVETHVADPWDAVTPVVSRSAAAQVADQIVLAVREERLRVGDRLPSERDLAKRFGISRPTIRETLAALELAGIVESQQGRGTSVVATSAQVAMWGVEIVPPQVFEARLAIEPELACLAAKKQYPEDIAALRAALDELEAEFAATGTYDSDLAIHRAIAKAARNPVLERALDDALTQTRSKLWSSLRSRAFRTADASKGHLDELRAVVQHIEAGRSEEAAEVWRRHLVRFRDEMLGRSPETGQEQPGSADSGQR